MKRRKSRPRRKECKDERKLRELAKTWHEATVGIGNYATMRPLTEVERMIARACADELEAVLAETEGL